MNKEEKHYTRIIERIIDSFADSYSESENQINIHKEDGKTILCYVKDLRELFIDRDLINYLKDALPWEGMDYVKPAAKKYFHSQIEGENLIRTISVAGIV